MKKSKILVVDDEELIRWSLDQNLTSDGYEVLTAASGEEALKIIREEMPDLVFLDLQLPGIGGMEVLQKVKEISKDIIVIIITALGIVEMVVKAMKLGAFDYINKPFNLDEVSFIVEKATEAGRLRHEVTALRAESEKFKLVNIIGSDPKMKEVMAMVDKVVKSDSTTVLITGESGTGKELVAKSIHNKSARAKGPFMTVNCAALPENLLESELMGHERGAFTDAKTMRKGLFELADGGTLFLDEIGDMPLGMQAKILRVLEDKIVRRLGGAKDISVDVRIVSATNKDLFRAIDDGTFRSDLYYRLQVIPIKLAPLRERRGDIIPLTMHYIEQFNKEFNKNVKGISKVAEKFLVEYSWPGNVRELKNIIERALILEDEDTLLVEHLPLEIVTMGSELKKEGFEFDLPPEGISMEKVEMEMIQQALAMVGGNQSKAAKKLDLGIDAFRYRMKKFGLVS
ncbi:MAG: sigma-54-dependent Fis family transcriptional regulator [Proteobacteria bacterium]|nr:sigma-54-dependent Fis family transcriptional regulator [Pseudomonadota bacterium]